MKNIFIICFFMLYINTTFSQYRDTLNLKQNDRIAAKAQHICIWGDFNRMELHPNGKIYCFREGLEDGLYTAFFDKKYKDTAMVVVMENGKLNGLLQRWYNGKIEEVCEYRNGLMNGWRKIYYYTDDGLRLLDIEKCENNACVEVYTEW